MLKIKDYRRDKVVVIADDLTGAGEIGSILAENNKKSLTINEELGRDEIERLFSEYEGIVINLNTRSLSPEDAYSKTKYFLETFPSIKNRLIYKKIDSTLRGNIVEEIEAILDLNCCDTVFFAPALPKFERITIGGYHLVNGLPVGRSYYAKKDSNDLKSSYLPSFFKKCKYKTAIIPINEVEKGSKKIIDSINSYHEKNVKIILSDACTDEDLFNIKEAILKANVSILPTGSSGLFYQFFPERTQEISSVPPCLIVCGSLNKIARNQIEKLREKENVEYIEIDLSRIFAENEEERYIKKARKILEKRHTLILATPPEEYKIYHNKISTGEKITELLGKLTAEIVKSCKLCGLILTGGNTALSVMRRLKTKGMEVKKDIDFLIPAGILKGGPFEGMPVVTKAGGFGGKDVLIKAVKYLKEEYCRQKEKETKVE